MVQYPSDYNNPTGDNINIVFSRSCRNQHFSEKMAKKQSVASVTASDNKIYKLWRFRNNISNSIERI
jgi:hypothetical protein